MQVKIRCHFRRPSDAPKRAKEEPRNFAHGHDDYEDYDHDSEYEEEYEDDDIDRDVTRMGSIFGKIMGDQYGKLAIYLCKTQ